MTPPEELLILAPAHELQPDFIPWQVAGPQNFRCAGETDFNLWVEALLDEGVYFPTDQDQRFPKELPSSLDGFRCVLIDANRKPEFATGLNAGRLHEFRCRGGFVWYAGPASSADTVHMHTQRYIAAAGLTLRHPAMLNRLRAIPDERLIDWWTNNIGAQAKVLESADAGWAWGDPVAYHLYWPGFEAARYFNRTELLEPLWDFMRAGLDTTRWPGTIACGRRFALKLYETSGDRSILERVVRESSGPGPGISPGASRPWLLDGITLNHDLLAPGDVDPNQPPPLVRDNAWVWCETAGNIGDSLGYLSQASGDPQFAEQAVRQVRATHAWCFHHERGLWFHLGRPQGPDLRSAPWGRGNGWLLYGIRGLLEDLPARHPARAQLVRMLAEELEGLLRFQGPSGLWHNVLDATEETSRQDTAGAWMFINVYARAYWKGWLRDPRIPAMCDRAWQGLKTKVWRGLPIAHCSGTSYMLSRQGYLERPHCKFLGHGMLLAAIEIRRMREVLESAETPAPTVN